MFKRTLSALAVGAVLSVGSMTSANAAYIQFDDYLIVYSGYVTGTFGYTRNCISETDCNAAGGAPASGTSGDTAGIIYIESIKNTNNNQVLYTAGTNTDFQDPLAPLGSPISTNNYLTGIFSDIVDYNVTVNPLTTTANATGGKFSIYSNALTYNQSLGSTGGNLDALTYPTISNTGNLFLSGRFVAGVLSGDGTTTYNTTYNNNSPSGVGAGLIKFDGGSAINLFGLDSIALLDVSFNDNASIGTRNGWDAGISGLVSGVEQNVPEPGSLALMALAMLGLGVTTARRRSNKS